MVRTIGLIAVFLAMLPSTRAQEPEAEIQQITFGPKHHFFGYIGHCRTIPWNASGRYILALRTDFQDRMPSPSDAAEIVLLDTQDHYRPVVVERTRAWNFQQGTMFYWNPEAPETQFFFNDRDPQTGKVYCVLFDLSMGLPGKRIREFRFDDTPVGNGGVAQNGGAFLAINYGRLARLRPVTGYPDAHDWTVGVKHPSDDGIFKIHVATGEKTLLVSYKALRDAIAPDRPDVDNQELFINHTLWSRDDDLIYFYARGNFEKKDRINVPFTVRPDGTGLSKLEVFVGGHPEWAPNRQIIGCAEKKQVIYDVETRKLVRTLGDTTVFPNPEGDIALSPDATWLANGYVKSGRSGYVFYRMDGGEVHYATAFDVSGYTQGELRIDPSPAWNRDGTAVLFPSLTNDAPRTRQLFVLKRPGD